MKRILIATPSYDGKLDVWYTDSLCRTLLGGVNEGIIFNPVFMSYDSLVQRARNDLLAIAIDNKFDGVLWIDADMKWDAEWAIALVNSGKDIIGLPCIKKSMESEAYNVKCSFDSLLLKEGLIEVEAVGTGFLYMSSKACKYIWDNSEPYVCNAKSARTAFEVVVKDGELVSEDVNLCEKLRDGGFNIFIDPTKTCEHIGVHKFVGDFSNFIKKLGVIK